LRRCRHTLPKRIPALIAVPKPVPKKGQQKAGSGIDGDAPACFPDSDRLVYAFGTLAGPFPVLT